MASLLIKNIPPALHAHLKKQAAAHRRSLNSETILVLEQAVSQPVIQPPAKASAHDLQESALANLPPDIADRLRALRLLRESVASRQVDIEAWKRTAYDSRR